MVKSGVNNSLMGEFTGKVVDGNRIVFPSSLRKEVGKSFIITKGYDGCLLIVPSNAWNKLIEPMESRSFLDQNVRDSLRFLVGSAFKTSSDAQGRVVVPESLRKFSSIEYKEKETKEVIFIGLLNWIEVWDKTEWQKRSKLLDQTAEKIAHNLLNVNSEE